MTLPPAQFKRDRMKGVRFVTASPQFALKTRSGQHFGTTMMTIGKSGLTGLMMGAALAMGAAAPALADGRVYVPLPDLSSFEGLAAEKLLYELVLATVVGSNCPEAALTDEEWSLLSDSSDILAYRQLGLDVDTYDDQVFRPAFDALDLVGTCETVGPRIGTLLDFLIAHGGSLERYPDQDAAYLAWSAMQDEFAGMQAQGAQ